MKDLHTRCQEGHQNTAFSCHPSSGTTSAEDSLFIQGYVPFWGQPKSKDWGNYWICRVYNPGLGPQSAQFWRAILVSGLPMSSAEYFVWLHHTPLSSFCQILFPFLAFHTFWSLGYLLIRFTHVNLHLRVWFLGTYLVTVYLKIRQEIKLETK